MGWLAPPLHRVRGVVVGSPVRGNGPPLSARVGRSPVVPDGWTVFPPIRHLAGRVQSLRGCVLPGLKMRPAISLTVFVPKVANTASPAPASVASAMRTVMAWTVSRQGFALFWNISRQTRRPARVAYARMKMLIPRAISPCVTLQGLRSFSGAGAVRCVSYCFPLVVFPGPRRGRGAGRQGLPDWTGVAPLRQRRRWPPLCMSLVVEDALGNAPG